MPGNMMSSVYLEGEATAHTDGLGYIEGETGGKELPEFQLHHRENGKLQDTLGELLGV